MELVIIVVLTILSLLWAVKMKFSSKPKCVATTEMCDEVPAARSSQLQNFKGGRATVVDILKWRAKLHPHKVLHIFLDDKGEEVKRLTYADVDLGARKVAALLQTKTSVKKGDRVILCYPPGLEFAIGLWGCLYAGAVAIPVYPPYPGTLDRDLPKFNKLVEDSGATVVLTNKTYAMASKMGTLKTYFGSSMGVSWPKSVTWFETDNLGAELASQMKEVASSLTDLAFFQYSSGSTSSPKAVMISHGNIRGQMGMWSSLTPSSVSVSWLPTYHDMGLVGFILVPAFTASCCVSMSPLSFIKDPALWLRVMHKYRGNMTCAPNFGFALVARKVTPAERARLDLSCWTEAVCAAEPIRADVLSSFTRTFAPCGFRPTAFNCGYGLAETTLTLTGRNPDVPSDPVVLFLSKTELESNKRAVDVGSGRSFQEILKADPATSAASSTDGCDPAEVVSLVGCGEPAPGLEVCVVDPETRVAVEDNVVGEVWARGTSIAQGYYGRPEQTTEAFRAQLAGAEEEGAAADSAPVDTPVAGVDTAEATKPSKKKKNKKKKAKQQAEGAQSPTASAAAAAAAVVPATALACGWLRTGDLGFRRGGVLFITGRLKDLIIVRGRNILPQDVELTVESCHASVRPGCSAAFSVEVETESGGGDAGAAATGAATEERLVVVAELREVVSDEGVRRELVRAIQSAIFTDHQLPCHAVVLLRPRCIPKTTSGKIQRHASKLGFLDGTLKTQHTAFFRGAPAAPASAPAAAPAADSGASEKSTDVTKSDSNSGTMSNSKKKRMRRKRTKQVATEEGGATTPAPTPSPTSDSTTDATSEEGGGVKRTPEEIEAWILKQLAARLEGSGPEGVDPTTSWAALGLDSISLVSLASELGDWLGTVVPPSALFDHDSVRKLSAALGGGKSLSSSAEGVGEKSFGDSAEASGEAGSSGFVPRAHYDVGSFPEYVALKNQIQALESAGLRLPYLTELDPSESPRERPATTNSSSSSNPKKTLNYNTYNYLGLAGSEPLCNAAKDAIETYGTSMCSSPIVGQNSINLQLEREICTFTSSEAAVVFLGGWQANVSTIAALVGPPDLILCDALAHNCCVVGAKLSGASVIQFPHNDAAACERVLQRVRSRYRRVLLLVEGCYSMDGDIPDLPRFVAMKKAHNALLFVDEAHSLGTMGPTGRGVAEYYGLPMDCMDVRMGTLSKAFGSCGGFIAGSAALIELLKFTAGGFVFSVGMAPAAAGAAVRSLQLAGSAKEGGARVAALQHNAAQFLHLATAAGLNTGMSHDSPVIPVIVGSSQKTALLSEALATQGINVKPIVYPAVEEHQARLRFFISARLTQADLVRTVDALVEEARKLEVGSEKKAGAGPEEELAAVEGDDESWIKAGSKRHQMGGIVMSSS